MKNIWEKLFTSETTKAVCYIQTHLKELAQSLNIEKVWTYLSSSVALDWLAYFWLSLRFLFGRKLFSEEVLILAPIFGIWFWMEKLALTAEFLDFKFSTLCLSWVLNSSVLFSGSIVFSSKELPSSGFGFIICWVSIGFRNTLFLDSIFIVKN